MTSSDLLSLASAQGLTLDPCLLKDYPIGTYFYAVHHQVIAEPLTEPLANRLHYILTEKPVNERKTRLAALRPVLAQKAYAKACTKANAARAKAYDEAYAAYAKALLPQWDKEYPDHPKWNENGLVFPGKE